MPLTSSTGCCGLEGMGDCRILGRSVYLVVGLMPEASTVRLYIRVAFGSNVSMSSLVPISREFRSSILYCASNWGGKANSAGLHINKKKGGGEGTRHVLVRSPGVFVSIVSESESVLDCPSTISPGYTGCKYRTRMHSPSYDLPREILLVREEAERRPYGTTHALRSMASGWGVWIGEKR